MRFIYELISAAASATEMATILGFGLHSGIHSVEGKGTEEGATTNTC